MVVFDSSSGLRLADVALPPDLESAAAAVADTLTLASRKRARNAADLQAVCVLAVRNADLPRSMDPLCDATALLLERMLVGSPGIAVLERRRLEAVNAERNLPTADRGGPLLTSLVTIELEISRGEGGGLKAVALLSDSKGKLTGRVRGGTDTANAAALAAAPAREIANQLRIAPAPPMGNPAREARRFVTEARFLRENSDVSGAVRAAEAAFALSPTDESRTESRMPPLSRATGLLYAPDRGDADVQRSCAYSSRALICWMD